MGEYPPLTRVSHRDGHQKPIDATMEAPEASAWVAVVAERSLCHFTTYVNVDVVTFQRHLSSPTDRRNVPKVREVVAIRRYIVF